MLVGVCACSPPAPSSEGGTTTDPSTTEPTSTSDAASSETTQGSQTGEDTQTSEDSQTEEDSQTSEDTETLFGPPGVDLGHPPECDPINQDCPEGEKCVPYGSTGGNWDANHCVPVSGEGSAGQPCTYWGTPSGEDSCDEAHLCWNAQDDGQQLTGTCMPMCTGSFDDPVCPPDASCLIANYEAIAVCAPRCDPLVQDCAQGEACVWSGADFVCVVPSEAATLDEPCGFANDCSTGQLCIAQEALPGCEGLACCAQLCNLEDPQCASPGRECVPFLAEGMGPPQFYPEGLCVAPQGCPDGCSGLITSDHLAAPWG